jgi:hypothetical protein
MAVPDGWPPARGDTGAQNPAYRPARPPPELDGSAMRRGWGEASLSTSAGHSYGLGSDDLPSLAELIRQTPGAHPIGSVDELRCDIFEDGQELDDFLAFVAASRHAGLSRSAWRRRHVHRCRLALA